MCPRVPLALKNRAAFNLMIMLIGEFNEQQLGWVIMTPKHPNGGKLSVYWFSFRRTRTEAIAEFIKGSGMTWRRWRKQYGFVAVKATADFRVSASIQNLKKMGMDGK